MFRFAEFVSRFVLAKSNNFSLFVNNILTAFEDAYFAFKNDLCRTLESTLSIDLADLFSDLIIVLDLRDFNTLVAAAIKI